MKILLTTGIYPPDIGGPATYIPQLAADLNANGDKVVIVTLAEKNQLVVENNVRIRKINRNYPLPFRMFITSLVIFWELRKCEALFSNGLFLESAIALSINKKKHSVVKIVGDPIWEILRNRGLTNLSLTEYLAFEANNKKKFLRKIYNWSWSRFDYRTSPSLELCEMVNRNLNVENCLHIPNGVEIFPKDGDSKSFDLITVSRLVNWKNLDIVIKVASKLKQRLLIVGSGPDEMKLRDLAGLLGCDAVFTGQVTPERARELTSQAKFFIQISDYEGLSFSLLEAMSLGLVPIVSNVKGNTAVISNMENGIVIGIDESQLTKAIENLLEDKKLAEKLSKSAFMTVESHYNGNKQRKLMIDLIKK